MGIADKLLAKTAGVTAKPIGAAIAADSAPKTSPGRLMDAQSRISAAQSRIAELEKTAGQSFTVIIKTLVIKPGRRRRLTPEQRSELKANLEINPLAVPVTVRRLADGRYELVAGHNRAEIYEELGRAEISATLVELDDDQAEYAAFFSNLLSPTLSDFEKYWSFKALQDQTGVTQEQLAKSAGLSAPHVTRIMKFHQLPAEAKSLLAERPDRLGASAAEKLVEFGRATPEKIVEAVQKLVADDSFTQKQAVALVTKKLDPAAARPKYDVRVGKRKICEITHRNGVIGIRMHGEKPLDADDWAKRIQMFIQDELARTSSDS